MCNIAFVMEKCGKNRTGRAFIAMCNYRICNYLEKNIIESSRILTRIPSFELVTKLTPCHLSYLALVVMLPIFGFTKLRCFILTILLLDSSITPSAQLIVRTVVKKISWSQTPKNTLVKICFKCIVLACRVLP